MQNDRSSIIDTIQAMHRQEAIGYINGDYLNMYSPDLVAVNVDCRTKMAQWCYSVVDFCSFNRETVAIAMSYLDRFLLTPAGLPVLGDTNAFQLAAMTSLYTAVKIHEPEIMGVDLVSKLSRGQYSPQEIETMEFTILQALGWKVNTPTALSFVRKFLELLPMGTLEESIAEAAYDLSKFQSELAVGDYNLVPIQASTVAYASIINSLEGLAVDATLIETLAYTIAAALRIDITSQTIRDVQNYLYQAISQQSTGEAVANNSPARPKAAASSPCRSHGVDASPRTVEAMVM
ncbi:diatom-specific cyclin [Seminavis robusta]|uniref:Diatom-specific cyclin n=1 Tax=Seminavis robusta TaxID=568900 RepID=A0A9N8HVJ4_9STRA|nr:diatom-specific cyclin [Seminavis robusta]|eukprot:Sro1512_g278790.1 diatom-specific cyclin (291) ;mRNA; f:7092-8149